jgi:hypothetical protein
VRVAISVGFHWSICAAVFLGRILGEEFVEMVCGRGCNAVHGGEVLGPWSGVTHSLAACSADACSAVAIRNSNSAVFLNSYVTFSFRDAVHWEGGRWV